MKIHAMSLLIVCFSLSFFMGCSHGYERWLPEETAFKINGDWMALRLSKNKSPEDQFVEWVDYTKTEKVGSRSVTLGSAPLNTEFKVSSKDLARLIQKRGYFDVYREFSISAAAYSGSSYQVAKINEAKRRSMYRREFSKIKEAGRNPLFGVALSGGGVRSASFSQGVLQGLHELEQLKNVGYLSTVSGGGYTGGWYMTHAQGSDKDLFKPASRHLYHLAQYGSFLASGNATGSTLNYLFTIIFHNFFLPPHIIANVFLDADTNIGFIRRFYRLGIANSYLYALPHSRDGQYVGAKSMSAWNVNVDRPFWIVNTNLSLIDDDSHHKNRVGDNFEITPLKSGANAVGFVKTVSEDKYSDSFIPSCSTDVSWMGESYAIAASGAAVDSKGLATNPLYTYALDFMNGNMGYYIPGWSPTWVKWDDDNRFWSRVSSQICHWSTVAFPVLAFNKQSHARTVDSRRFYITDGGHLENLGLYALVRRGCRLIVVSDSSRDTFNNRWDTLSNNDKGKAFDDLRKFEKLLYSDFGARLKIDWKNLSGKEGFAFVATIPLLPIWPECSANPINEVKIIYLKAAYSDTNPLRNSTSFINAEKAENKDFANASTADVDFSERQVISQRELGRQLILKLKDKIIKYMPPDPSLSARAKMKKTREERKKRKAASWSQAVIQKLTQRTKVYWRLAILPLHDDLFREH